MYISPFWCGVIATVVAEFVLINLVAMLCGKKNREDERKERTGDFEDN